MKWSPLNKYNDTTGSIRIGLLYIEMDNVRTLPVYCQLSAVTNDDVYEFWS
jgi:hypothetical protein